VDTNEPGDFRSRLKVQGTIKINVRRIVQVEVNFEFMTKDFQRITAFVFGIVFVAAMLVLAVFIPNPTPFQYTVFRIVLALAAAGAAAMFPGFLTARVGNVVRAGGAMAVFVIWTEDRDFFGIGGGHQDERPGVDISERVGAGLDIFKKYL
jgi:hypothetical protein